MNASSGASARVASASGALAGKVASAADPGRSTVGRLVDAAAAVQLAARVVPGAWRFLRRYPFSATLIILGLAGAAYSWRFREHPD